MDVVVVGAGLGGLAAAVAVHRAGHAVTVLERAAALREAGAGIGLMPNGVRALDALGLGAPVRAQAAPFAAGGLRDRYGRPLLAVDQAAVARHAGAPLAVVERTWLHRLLAAALPGGTVQVATPVRAVRDDGGRGRIDALLPDRTGPGPARAPDLSAGLTAELVVAADGAGSGLRAALFPDHPGLTGSGELAARALAPAGLAVDPVPGELLDHRTGDRFGCLPLADGRTYWYATWAAGRAVPTDAGLRLAALRARYADWHPTVGALLAATDPETVHVAETVRLVTPLPALHRHRTALLGDAAHAMTPDLGQGGCQAFEDAVALGEVLAGARPGDVPAALARYDARRRAPTTALQRRSRSMNRVLRLRGRSGVLRDAALRAVPRALATRALARQFAFDHAQG